MAALMGTIVLGASRRKVRSRWSEDRLQNIRVGMPFPQTGANLLAPLPQLVALRRVIAGHPADDLPLYRVRLFGHRTCQCPKVVSGIVELIDQRQNDWQARVIEAH